MTVIVTLKVPFGRPVRSIGSPSALPRTERTDLALSRICAATICVALTLRSRMRKRRRLTHALAPGSAAIFVIATGVAAGFAASTVNGHWTVVAFPATSRPVTAALREPALCVSAAAVTVADAGPEPPSATVAVTNPEAPTASVGAPWQVTVGAVASRLTVTDRELEPPALVAWHVRVAVPSATAAVSQPVFVRMIDSSVIVQLTCPEPVSQPSLPAAPVTTGVIDRRRRVRVVGTGEVADLVDRAGIRADRRVRPAEEGRAERDGIVLAVACR